MCCGHAVNVDTPWELLEELERRYREFLKEHPKVLHASPPAAMVAMLSYRVGLRRRQECILGARY